MTGINRIINFFKQINPDLRFLFFLLGFSLIYNYQSIVLKRPQSVHHWRQADCASLTLMYYQTGMDFFTPQTHNLTSNNNTSGYNATSEIPIGYYTIAFLYKIFGYHDFIYRLINTLIFLTGIFFLYKTLKYFINDIFWSSSIALLFFTSPVLVYYGNNFLTDSSAFAFGLIAWYFFIKFYQTERANWFYISMFFFLIAGSYKITSLISFVAIYLVIFSEFLFNLKFKGDKKLFPKPSITIIPFLIVLMLIGSWVIYAKHFNSIHGSGYFSTGILPFWEMSTEEINKVWDQVRILWLDNYFHKSTLIIMGLAFLLNLILIKKANLFLLSINIILFLGVLIYGVLWFLTFKDHDYYTINLYILLVFTLITFISTIKSHFNKIFSSTYIKILFTAFLIFNMFHAKAKMRERYKGWWTEYPEYKAYHTISPYLKQIGIQPLDTVICLPDDTHFTLYLMNLRGWTACLGNNLDSSSVSKSIQNGAKYLIVNGDEFLKREYLKSYTHKPFGQYENIRIYELK